MPKDVQFPLVLMGGEVLVFDASLLKYMGIFENLYKDGFFSYHEHKDFKLDYSLWRLVLSFLAEYDKSGGESEPAKNSWARVIASLDLPRLYDMVRIMNYYDVVVAMRAILAIIMPRLMIMPRPMLKQLHPRAAIKSESDMLSAMHNNPFKIINKQYAFRREEILAVCVAYIQTHDIIQIIDRSFLPAVTSNICSMTLLITSSGLAAVGDNTYGHLGTGVENKDWTAQEEQYQGDYEFPDESEEEREQRLAQWEKWREERLAKPDWLPVPMPKHLDVISVATGGEHTLILTTDGLYGAGSATHGEFGSLGDERALALLQYEGGQKVQRYFSPMRLGLTNVLLVGCGFWHSMIYTTQGLYVAGSNCCDQLGVVGFGMESKTFMHIPFDEEVAALALAGNVSFVLTKTGRVYRAGNLMEDDSTPLHHIVTETRIVAVSTTPLRALFLGEYGDVYLHSWETSGNFPAYEKIVGLPPIAAIFAIGQDESFFIDAKGVVYARNESSFTSHYSIDPYNDLIVIIPFPHPVITVIYHDDDYYFVTCDGLYAWNKATLTFDRVDLQLSDVPICGGSSSSILTTTLQKQICCHHCGENDRTSLGYNKAMQRVFCHTKACLSEYKSFRVI